VHGLQDHDTVINVIDAVVDGTEKFSKVAGMKRGMARSDIGEGGNVFHARAVPVTANVCGRQVKTSVWQEPRRRYWRPNAVSGENESRTRA